MVDCGGGVGAGGGVVCLGLLATHFSASSHLDGPNLWPLNNVGLTRDGSINPPLSPAPLWNSKFDGLPITLVST